MIDASKLISLHIRVLATVFILKMRKNNEKKIILYNSSEDTLSIFVQYGRVAYDLDLTS